jgi:hypothetical protein
MTYIPDTRTDKYYNQKYLNDKDREFIRGFDWCLENAVDIFFDNISDLGDYEDSYLEHVLNAEVPESLKDEYELEYTFSDVKETRKIVTYADYLRSKLLDWVESERDQLITSMIDGMDDAEYDKIKEVVDRDSYEKGEEDAE